MLTAAAVIRYALAGAFIGAALALTYSAATPAPAVELRGTIAPAMPVTDAEAWCWYYDGVWLGRCYTREHASSRMQQ